MAVVDILIGTGSFDDFHVHIATTWPAVPREGETIVRGQKSLAAWTVKAVQYVIGPEDEMVSAQVLVTDVAPDDSSP